MSHQYVSSLRICWISRMKRLWMKQLDKRIRAKLGSPFSGMLRSWDPGTPTANSSRTRWWDVLACRKWDHFRDWWMALKKNGKTGELGQDRLEVRWEAVMFLFNVVNLNVWLFLSINLAKCFVGVVWLMFGLDEGRVCWGCCGFTVLDSVH